MSALVDEESEFEKLGVKFLIIKEDMYDAVKDFYWEHFIPDEPVSRSLQISRGSFMDKFILTDILNHKCSIAAVNDNGDILAIRLAQIKSRGQWFDKIMDRAFMKIFRSEKLTAMLLGESWRRVGSTFIKLCKLINYDVWKAFDQLGCDKIYEDKAVCSARFHGIKGLGTEITKRSEALAAEMGCTHTYAMVTGKLEL